MPLLTIQAFPPADPQAIPKMLVELRDAGARALRCPPSNIWVVFQPIAPGHYVQELHSPIVIVRAQTGRSPEDRRSFVKAVANAVGGALSVPPKNVWIHYQEMRPEDVFYQVEL